MDANYKYWMVSKNNEFINADVYEDYGLAFDAWHALAKTLDDGESSYMQRFNAHGDVDEDYYHELRNEDGDILEYYKGERMWA